MIAGIQTRILAAVAVLVALLCMPAALRADIVTTKSGKQIVNAQVESLGGELTPGLFMVRILETGSFDSVVHPVERAHVVRIDFDAGDGIGGRVARIVFADGKTRDNARTIFYDGATESFSVVVPGGGLRENIPAARIASMAFAKGKLLPAEIKQVDDPAAAAAAAVPTPVPPPIVAAQPGAAQPAAEDAEEYVDLDVDDDGQFDQALGPAMGIGPDMGVSDLDYSGFEEDEDDGFGGFAGEDTGFVNVPFLGWAIGVMAVLAYVVLGTLAGATQLWWSSRLEQVNDFPFWKSCVTALCIAIFPPGFFLLCLKFIPIFGMWAGLAAWYGSTRAIIMGMMEILEEKAESVIFTYTVIQIGVFLAAIYFL